MSTSRQTRGCGRAIHFFRPEAEPGMSCLCGRTRRSPERDIVQAQKRAWEHIAQEEREGKRQPPIVRWAA